MGSYIKKRRLSNGARELLYTDRRIIDIAISHGFESSEAFSRAFKSVYHVSPIKYRQNRLELFISSKPKMDQLMLAHLTNNLTVHPRILELPDIKAAGLRGFTTLGDNVIPGLWDTFRAQMHLVPNTFPSSRGFGICEACEEGNSLYTMNDDVLFPEVAAVEVSSFENLPSPFIPKILKGGKYAVFTHTGSLKNLSLSFRYIWSTWFLTTDEQLDEREDFELYDGRFLGYDCADSQIDLYIPVK